MIFTEAVVHEDTLSEVDLMEKIKVKLLGHGWPLDALTEGKRKIEETLGLIPALETLVKDISDKLEGRLDKLLLDPAHKLSEEPPLGGTSFGA